MLLYRPSTVAEALDCVDDADPAGSRFYAGGLETVFALRTEALEWHRLIVRRVTGEQTRSPRAGDDPLRDRRRSDGSGGTAAPRQCVLAPRDPADPHPRHDRRQLRVRTPAQRPWHRRDA